MDGANSESLPVHSFAAKPTTFEYATAILFVPTIVGQAQYGPVRCQESTSGSESDSEPTSPHHLSQVTPGSIVPSQGTISQQEVSRDTTGHALSESIMLPTPPEAIVRPPDTHTGISSAELVSSKKSYSPPSTRRSFRSCRPPAWQYSDERLMETNGRPRQLLC